MKNKGVLMFGAGGYRLLPIFILSVFLIGNGCGDSTAPGGTGHPDDDIICEPAAQQCNDQDIERCNAAGDSWVIVSTCLDEEICQDGVCHPISCAPGTKKCIDDDILICSAEGDSWLREECPENTQCLFGQCVECISNAGCPEGSYCENGLCVARDVTITTMALPDGIEEEPYELQLEAQDGVPPYSWNVVQGDFPDGLNLTDSGLISGTPMEMGTYSFRLRVSDSGHSMDEADFSITILSPGLRITTPSSLPVAEEGYDYEVTLAAVGGSPPYAWMISSGAMPQGLEMMANGHIEGIPNEVGHFNFTARVFDNQETSASDSKEFLLTVEIAPLVIVGDTMLDLMVTRLVILDMLIPLIPYSDNLQAKGGLRPYQWEEKPLPQEIAWVLTLAGIDVSNWGLPDELTLQSDGSISGWKADTSDAVTLNIPFVNVEVSGYIFFAEVTDSQNPVEKRSAVFCVPTVALDL